MAESTAWWLLAAALVALELFTGTFYLLMLAIGLAAGALAAHLGLSLSPGSWWSPRWWDRRPRSSAVTWQNGGAKAIRRLVRMRSVNLDIGETLQVDTWQATARPRCATEGAQWTVVLAPGQTPARRRTAWSSWWAAA